jgi:hypothetical protein
MPPTPQPTTPRPLIIVVWLSVPTSESGKTTSRSPCGRCSTPRERYSRLTWWTMPGRRHDLEVGEGLLAPAQELVALAVALELDRGVVQSASGRVVLVDLHAVVDDEVDRHERVDRLRVAAHPLHRAAQRGQVDDGRHAGEVLEHDAAGLKGTSNSPGRRGRRRRGAHVLGGHVVAVLVAQHALEQDLDRERQPVDVGQAVLLQLREPVVVGGAAARLEGGAGAEAVLGRRSSMVPPDVRPRRGRGRTPAGGRRGSDSPPVLLRFNVIWRRRLT